MAHQKPLLLLTRPRVASQRVADQLPETIRNRVEICIAPLIDIETCQTAVPMSGVKGIIFTSANAVIAAQALQVEPSVPAYCVGDVTTRTAQDAGWASIAGGDTARELLARLIKMRPATPLLHLSGRNLRVDLATELSAAGLETRNCTIYEQPLQELSDATQDRIDRSEHVIAPVFSPRSAAQLAAQVRARDRNHVIAMSDAVAQSLKFGDWASVCVADKPTAASMLRSIVAVIERLTRVEGRPGAQ